MDVIVVGIKRRRCGNLRLNVFYNLQLRNLQLLEVFATLYNVPVHREIEKHIIGIINVL